MFFKHRSPIWPQDLVQNVDSRGCRLTWALLSWLTQRRHEDAEACVTQVPRCWPHTGQPLGSLILGPGAGPSSTHCTWAQVELQMALKGLAWVLHLHAILQPGPGIGEKAPYRRLTTLKREFFPPTNSQEWPTGHGRNCPEFSSVSRDTGARVVLYLPPFPSPLQNQNRI